MTISAEQRTVAWSMSSPGAAISAGTCAERRPTDRATARHLLLLGNAFLLRNIETRAEVRARTETAKRDVWARSAPAGERGDDAHGAEDGKRPQGLDQTIHVIVREHGAGEAAELRLHLVARERV